ncbi:uncharacterized protein LOC130613676 isoform X1 [Hydractinia symbiolongicarpus]|uniref:uncharacterized protein LOC130613676 isoform X1 n=1 Tax=Hydractinia symbiolongicarpus TaxID=13093 RepID=UPI00254AC156|nr:uncharacterized protein LOC130613676 isoform X1 [Hydractinia symbiolongicarpus]
MPYLPKGPSMTARITVKFGTIVITRESIDNSCNLKYKMPSHKPMIFHNLSGYDAHLFIRELGKKYDTQDIGCIAENTEKYISFNVKIKVPLGGMGYGDGEKYNTIEIRFIDSCRFMASSLDKLANNLNNEQCKNLRWFFNEDDTFQLSAEKAMRQDLPTDGLKWVSNVEAFTEKRIEKLVEDNRPVYILEVDIVYPERLHNKHNELSFLPQRTMVHRVEKLVRNVEDKRKYVVHIRALNEAVRHGLKLKRVRRVIWLNQKAWLKGYIDHNTRLRTSAKNEFKTDYYKLMNFSVFGKNMENIKNHRNIQLVTNEDKYTKLAMKPNFKGESRFSEHLVCVEMGKTRVKINKTVYIGQAILDMSKLVMCEFHYDSMQPKQGSKLQLCYMDTDSFMYHIRTEDFYRDIVQDVETRFDTSAYDADDGRPLPIGKNKKVVGLIKDELGGKIMT